MSSYQTIKGETWDSIAYKLWGSEYLTPLLFEANKKHINTLVFSGNEILTVPEFNSTNTSLVDKPKWIRNDVT